MKASTPGTLDATKGDKAEWTTLNADLVTIPADQKSLWNAKVTLKDNASAIMVWTVTKNGCSASDRVTIKDESVHAYAETPIKTCTGSGNLEATKESKDGVTYGWEKVDPNSKITIANAADATSSFSGMDDNAQVRVKWVVTSTNAAFAGGCKSEKEVLIVNNGYTNAINAGENASVCGADGYKLSATVPSGYQGVWMADNSNVRFGADKENAVSYANAVNETEKTMASTCDGGVNVYNLAVGDNTLTWYIMNIVSENATDDDPTKFACINKKSIVITNGDITAPTSVYGPTKAAAPIKFSSGTTSPPTRMSMSRDIGRVTRLLSYSTITTAKTPPPPKSATLAAT